jgi:Ca2+-transporting ATPase
MNRNKTENTGHSVENPDAAWSMPWDKVAQKYDVDVEEGLSPDQVQSHRSKYGVNKLRAAQGRTALEILLDQAQNIIIFLLAAASVVSLIFNQLLDAAAIAVAIGLNLAIGFMTEWRAVRSIEALKKMTSAKAKVLRRGKVRNIGADKLVTGDVVMLEEGDLIPADIRLFEAAGLQVDESSLTGESTPVPKDTEPLDEQAALADRTNMVFRGAVITSGSGKGVISAVGMDTELGKISEMAEEAEQEATPLEKKLDKLGGKLVWVTLAISFLVLVIGLGVGKDTFLIVETAIALAVAAVPEGLPIVATIELAQGMRRMARRNALINKLASVETLGSVNTIFTDKTGTLTENKMTVRAVALGAGDGDSIQDFEIKQGEDDHVEVISQDSGKDENNRDRVREVIEIGVLCSNAHLNRSPRGDRSGSVGDPMEIALLELGWKLGSSREDLLESQKELKEVAFNRDVKMMATFHEAGDHIRVAVKGAPEQTLENCVSIRYGSGRTIELNDRIKELWLDHNLKMAQSGFRIIALAEKTAESTDEDPYHNLTFQGLAGFVDPASKGVDKEIENLKRAGITVIMVTGDQKETAYNIGEKLGIVFDDSHNVIHGKDLKPPEEMDESERDHAASARIFARVDPAQKLDLIQLYQKEGAIVAMTGDGVNDAPALKKADVGVAMGKKGTEVARQAADVVLKDDKFSAIVVAVRQGRVIFDNIRRFILFLISGNVGEIMIVAFALLSGMPLPLLPLQILYLNMIGDVFPALALGMGEGDPSVMNRPARDPAEAIITPRHWLEILAYGFVIALTSLFSFHYSMTYMGKSPAEAVTFSFLTLSFARLWHVFNMKDWGAGLVRNGITRNPWVWGALVLCAGLLTLAVYAPQLAMALDLRPPNLSEWGFIIGVSIIPLVILQAIKTGPIARKINITGV